MSFKEFLNKLETNKKTEEDIFFDVVGVRIPSLKSFIAWLILKNEIKPYFKESKNSKPLEIFKLSTAKKIKFLVQNVSDLKEKAMYFSNTIK